MFTIGRMDRGHDHFSYAVLRDGEVFVEFGTREVDAQITCDALNAAAKNCLTPDDFNALDEIMNTFEPLRRTRLIYAYYRDKGRANRTPRRFLYLHIGILMGTLIKEEQDSALQN